MDSVTGSMGLRFYAVFGPGGAAEGLAMKPRTLASRIKALGIAAGGG